VTVPSATLAREQADRAWLDVAVGLARHARATGNRPFGAVLVSPADNELARACNTVLTDGDVTGHAETNVVRLATGRPGTSDLAEATLYTSTEPCAMCAGAIVLAGIGRVVYALSAGELAAIPGASKAVRTLPASLSDSMDQRDGIPTMVHYPLASATDVHSGFWAVTP